MTAQWRQGKRIAVIGAGPGGVSAAIAARLAGFDVRLYERHANPTPLGGAVLLSSPVLAILRHYGIGLENFGSHTRVQFCNRRGKVRADLKFNPEVEKALGIPGWHYGVLRSSAFGRMMDNLGARDAGILVPSHEFVAYEERPDGVSVRFSNGAQVECDLLVAADGLRSPVARQAFGDPQLFFVGLRLWLAWCDDIPGLPRHFGRIHHSRRIQASYFPMVHDGKPGFEWWVVEPAKEGDPPPADVEAHVRGLVKGFADPMPRFLEHTDWHTQIFRWDIYNRPSLQSYAAGRVVGVGDAVHPVSPYAAYGMGMAIEDGYFLMRALADRNLADRGDLAAGLQRYDSERVKYCNHHVEFARSLGRQFHHAPWPVALIRDAVFDHTGVLQNLIEKSYLEDSERLSLQLRELHVTDHR